MRRDQDRLKWVFAYGPRGGAYHHLDVIRLTTASEAEDFAIERIVWSRVPASSFEQLDEQEDRLFAETLPQEETLVRENEVLETISFRGQPFPSFVRQGQNRVSWLRYSEGEPRQEATPLVDSRFRLKSQAEAGIVVDHSREFEDKLIFFGQVSPETRAKYKHLFRDRRFESLWHLLKSPPAVATALLTLILAARLRHLRSQARVRRPIQAARVAT